MLARRHYVIAGKHFERNNLTAIPEYNIALTFKPDFASALHNRSLCWALNSEYGKAKADALKVMQIEPYSDDAPFVMAVVAKSEGRIDDAIAWCERALRNNPEYQSAKDLRNALLEKRSGSQAPIALECESSPTQWRSAASDVLDDGEIKSLAFVMPNFGFESIVGLEHAKDELYTQVVIHSKRPDLFEKYATKPVRGVLLTGPPGVGKTTLAAATAKEAGVNFIVMRIHQVVDKWSGNTEKNVHAIFRQAKDSKPCIIFIDELDGLGTAREKSRQAGENPSMALVVNQLLTEMDGVEKNPEGVFVIGATNHPRDLDLALRQRFSEEIRIELPSLDERRRLFEYFTHNTPHGLIDYEELASVTEGYSPREIEQVCNRAAVVLARNEYETGTNGILTTEYLQAILKQNRPDCGLRPLDFEVSSVIVPYA
jgi:SpoVK/Ycf46/Vps4 family AAA+-type ATPase